MIEQTVYDALQADAAVTALVAARIYPVELPEECPMPALDYKVIAGTNTGTFSSRGVRKTRIEIDCWGGTYSDAVNLRSAVVDCLDGQRINNATFYIIGPKDFFDDQLRQYRAMVEFYAIHTD